MNYRPTDSTAASTDGTYNQCAICGFYFKGYHNCFGKHRCIPTLPTFSPSTHGWTCPKCGSVYSPSTSSCWRCSAPPVVTNYWDTSDCCIPYDDKLVNGRWGTDD